MVCLAVEESPRADECREPVLCRTCGREMKFVRSASPRCKPCRQTRKTTRTVSVDRENPACRQTRISQLTRFYAAIGAKVLAAGQRIAAETRAESEYQFDRAFEMATELVTTQLATAGQPVSCSELPKLNLFCDLPPADEDAAAVLLAGKLTNTEFEVAQCG